jgi:hypothetical protein
LTLFYFHFAFSRIERVSHELGFHSKNQMRKGGRIMTSVIKMNLDQFSVEQSVYFSCSVIFSESGRS